MLHTEVKCFFRLAPWVAALLGLAAAHRGAADFPQTPVSNKAVAGPLLYNPAVFEEVVNCRIHHAALFRGDVKDRDPLHRVPKVLIPGEAPGVALLVVRRKPAPGRRQISRHQRVIVGNRPRQLLRRVLWTTRDSGGLYRRRAARFRWGGKGLRALWEARGGGGDVSAGDVAVTDQHAYQDTGSQQHDRHDSSEKFPSP